MCVYLVAYVWRDSSTDLISKGIHCASSATLCKQLYTQNCQKIYNHIYYQWLKYSQPQQLMKRLFPLKKKRFSIWHLKFHNKDIVNHCCVIWVMSWIPPKREKNDSRAILKTALFSLGQSKENNTWTVNYSGKQTARVISAESSLGLQLFVTAWQRGVSTALFLLQFLIVWYVCRHVPDRFFWNYGLNHWLACVDMHLKCGIQLWTDVFRSCVCVGRSVRVCIGVCVCAVTKGLTFALPAIVCL